MAATVPTETLNPTDTPMATTPPTETLNSTDTSMTPTLPTETLTPEPSDPTTEVGDKRKRSESEPDSKGLLWKTSLCSYFRRSNGACSHGDECRFAHNEEELRPRPDNSWDPSSERAKKIKKTEVELQLKADMEVPTNEPIADTELNKCLLFLPMNWATDKFKAFLDVQEVVYKSAKKKKCTVVGFISFETAEQTKKGVEVLDGLPFGSKNLKVADVIPRSFEKKNNTTTPPPSVTDDAETPDDADQYDDSLMPVNSDLKARTVRDAVAPLAHMSYNDQLEHKKNAIVHHLKKLTRNARKGCPNGVPFPDWITKSREIGGLACKLEGIIESPLVNGYRNKCEFSVGYSHQGKPTAGFLLGNFREGALAVEEAVDCPNISRIACRYAAIFQECLQKSELPIWNRLNNTGFWRQLTVREGRTPVEHTEVENIEGNISEVMLMVQVCSTGFDNELVNSEFEKMAQVFATEASASSPSLPLTALVIQDHKGISNVAPADAPLRSLPIPELKSDSGLVVTNGVAEPKIHDYINNLKFSISPTAFFQVNTLAAEKLYSLAGDWAGLGHKTLLFDICCGTGTIGLTLAHRVGMVVGIEMNASAVVDAQRNAEINGITNCRFVCSKAEDVLGSLLKEYLNVPQNPDAISLDKGSRMNGEDITLDKGTDASLDKVEENSGIEHKNGEDVVGHAQNDDERPESILQESCTSENKTTEMQQFEDVVAIVDPPRGGLHPTVIKALRTHPRLKRLVYISCNPETLVANAIELCTPSFDKNAEGNNKKNWGWRHMSSAGLARHRAKSMPDSEPFQPIKAMAVDIFPHTPHCELVMLLER